METPKPDACHANAPDRRPTPTPDADGPVAPADAAPASNADNDHLKAANLAHRHSA